MVSTAPILVVGGGPVGFVTALRLTAAGIPVLLVDEGIVSGWGSLNGGNQYPDELQKVQSNNLMQFFNDNHSIEF